MWQKQCCVLIGWNVSPQTVRTDDMKQPLLFASLSLAGKNTLIHTFKRLHCGEPNQSGLGTRWHSGHVSKTITSQAEPRWTERSRKPALQHSRPRCLQGLPGAWSSQAHTQWPGALMFSIDVTFRYSVDLKRRRCHFSLVTIGLLLNKYLNRI